jgi:hypothetical protein
MILLLTAISTAILGITTIPNRSSFALPIVAVVTALGTFEAFINGRPRWVLMEETQYRLTRLRDNVDYYLVTTPADGLSKQQLDLFYAEQQLIWADASRRWVQFRMPLARVHCLGPAKAGKASRRGGTSAGQSNEPN